jgi:hypothetical protein
MDFRIAAGDDWYEITADGVDVGRTLALKSKWNTAAAALTCVTAFFQAVQALLAAFRAPNVVWPAFTFMMVDPLGFSSTRFDARVMPLRHGVVWGRNQDKTATARLRNPLGTDPRSAMLDRKTMRGA